MKTSHLFLVGVVVLSFQGCATLPKPDYSKFFERHPRSILVLPPFNKTTGVEAPVVFNTTISRPLAERGYYVFPVFLTRDILNDLGLTDEGLIASVAPQQFKEVFGADAVLYVTIEAWTTQYLVLASNVRVTANYKLVDTDSGEVLWEQTHTAVESSGQSQGGGGLGAIVAMAISAAITAAVTDYRPLASRVNHQVVLVQDRGLPAGPYHPDYGKDYSNYKITRFTPAEKGGFSWGGNVR